MDDWIVIELRIFYTFLLQDTNTTWTGSSQLLGFVVGMKIFVPVWMYWAQNIYLEIDPLGRDLWKPLEDTFRFDLHWQISRPILSVRDRWVSVIQSSCMAGVVCDHDGATPQGESPAVPC